MTSKKFMQIIHAQHIERIIVIVRGEKVMLDEHLAILYEIPTKIFNQAIKRNLKRFPKDFMFQLTDQEYEILKGQINIDRKGRGGRRYLPFVFTEQGIAMLSSVLNSEKAVEVNSANFWQQMKC